MAPRREAERGRHTVRRTAVSFWVAIAMLVSLLGTAFIGLLLAFAMPRGDGGPPARRILWGLRRHDWGDIHLGLALTFLALVVLHIILHWSWIVCATLRRKRCQEPFSHSEKGS